MYGTGTTASVRGGGSGCNRSEVCLRQSPEWRLLRLGCPWLRFRVLDGIRGPLSSCRRQLPAAEESGLLRQFTEGPREFGRCSSPAARPRGVGGPKRSDHPSNRQARRCLHASPAAATASAKRGLPPGRPWTASCAEAASGGRRHTSVQCRPRSDGRAILMCEIAAAYIMKLRSRYIDKKRSSKWRIMR